MRVKGASSFAGRGKKRVKIKSKEKELNKLKSDVKEFRRGNVVIKEGKLIYCTSCFYTNIKSDLGKILMVQIDMFRKL